MRRVVVSLYRYKQNKGEIVRCYEARNFRETEGNKNKEARNEFCFGAR